MMTFYHHNYNTSTPFHFLKGWGYYCFFLFILAFFSLPVWAQDATKQASALAHQADRAYHTLMSYHRSDSLFFYQQAVEAMQLSLQSDSLDHLPDRKGCINPKWEDDNANRIKSLHPLLINAGDYFSRHQYPSMGVEALKLYLSCCSHVALKEELDERAVAYYYLSTIYFQSRGFRQADHYADLAMEYDDLALPAAEMKARCMHETMLTDTDSLRYLSVLRELYATDPTNKTYFGWIMKFYEHPTKKYNLDQFIDHELEVNPHSVTPWLLKGEVAMHNRLWMEAIEAYREADAIDDMSIPVVYNLGLCLTYEAHHREQLALSDSTFQSADGLSEDFLWQEACRYLERVRAMDPRRNKVDWVTPLYAVYVKLGKNAEAERLEPLVKKK